MRPLDGAPHDGVWIIQHLQHLLDDLDVLRDRFWDQQAMHIREAEVASLMSERKPCVVDAQQVEYGGVKIVDVHRGIDDVIRKVICLTDDSTWVNASSRHPHTKTTWMMVSSVSLFGKSTLGVNRPTEFASPDDECIFE